MYLFININILEIAIDEKQQEIIDMIWSRVDFTIRGNNDTYLSSSIVSKNFPTLKRLLAEDYVGLPKTSLLCKAAAGGSVDLFTYLRDAHHVPIETTEEISAENWIVAAATGGSLFIFVQVCAAVDADLHMRLDNGESLLHLACRAGSVELATHLIAKELGINDDQNTSKESPICCAVRSGSLPLVKYLMSAGANAAVIVSEHSSSVPGASLLHLAVSCNSHEILAWFFSGNCEARFNVERRDETGWMPIHHAAKLGNVECLKVLKANSAYMDGTTLAKTRKSGQNGITPLKIASYGSAVDAAAFLLGCGVNVNHQCEQGFPALYWAIPQQNQHNYTEDCFTTERYERAMRVIKLLLARKELKPNLRGNDTRWDTRPLDQAMLLQHVGIAQLLIDDPRVDVNGRCVKTGAPLSYAIEHEIVDIAVLLLKRDDLEVNEENSNQESSLDVAKRLKSTELVPLILAHPNFEGENPLFASVRENKTS